MKTKYNKKKYGSRKGKKLFSRKGKKHQKKHMRKSRKMHRRGGSPGLDKLGYGWQGNKIETWPGVQGNVDSITRSNHLMVSPYGVPVGGVELPYSTSGDNTGNSSVPVPSCQYKYMGGSKTRKMKGGYSYPKSSKRSTKKSPKHSAKQKRKIVQKGGIFFQDIRNFGRYLANGVKTRVNGVRGIEAPVGVMPTDQPYLDRDVKVIVSDPVDVEKIYLDNSKNVAKI